ncbi:MAG: hypothetical protein P4L84_06845, partial [Isosphaeraceae bacterium]|nr:hypothetical protein [Isosphaeraceae bacterium]
LLRLREPTRAHFPYAFLDSPPNDSPRNRSGGIRRPVIVALGPTETDRQGLHASIRARRLAALERAERMRVCRRHRLERQIADLESRPANEGRAKTLNLLREQLASV